MALVYGEIGDRAKLYNNVHPCCENSTIEDISDESGILRLAIMGLFPGNVLKLEDSGHAVVKQRKTEGQ